jgi:hypothetical protein
VSCEHGTDYLFLSGGLDGRGETKDQFLSLIEPYAHAGRGRMRAGHMILIS